MNTFFAFVGVISLAAMAVVILYGICYAYCEEKEWEDAE